MTAVPLPKWADCDESVIKMAQLKVAENVRSFGFVEVAQ